MDKREVKEGMIFGRLRVIKYAGIGKSSHSVWECLCDPELGGCGNVKNVLAFNLLKGNTRSCGCLRSELVAESHRQGKINLEKVRNAHIEESYTGSIVSRKSKSGVKGVYYRKDRNKWCVKLQDINGVPHNYGHYESKEEAIEVAKEILNARKQEFLEHNK